MESPQTPDKPEARVPARVEIIPPGEGPDFVTTEEEVLQAEHGRARSRGTQGAWSPMRRLLSHVPGVTTLVAVWSYFNHSAAPFSHKVWIAAAAVYVLWPRDLIPELPLGLKGQIDDLAVVFGLISFLGSERLAPYRARARMWLKGRALSPYLDDEAEA